MSLFDGKWIEIFRAGDYGEKGKYSESDLDQIVADYDPIKHEAPVVVGHPQNNVPAYGWVESLKRVGSTLLARFRQVAPAFAALVKEGRFKKRSVSLVRNPEGKLELRHVGFLGAMPPEVKGLADVPFGSTTAPSIEFSEGGAPHSPGSLGSQIGTVFSESADKLAAQENISVADALRKLRMLDWQRLNQYAALQLSKRDATSFSEATQRIASEGSRAMIGLDLSGAIRYFDDLKSLRTVDWQIIDHAMSQEISARENIEFSDAKRRWRSLRSQEEIDPRHVLRAVEADKVAREERISFGDALRRICQQADRN